MRKLYGFVTRVLTIIAFPLTALVLNGSRRVRVLITSGDKILLQRTSIGTQKWSLPGGGVEKNEDDAVAAVREVAEEVGITIAPEQLIHLGEDYRAVAGHKRWPKFTRVYLLVELPEQVEPKIQNPLEILESAWFSLDKIPEVDRPTLDTALKLLNTYKK